MTRLVITEAATADIEEICDYIAEDSFERAERLMDSIYAELAALDNLRESVTVVRISRQNAQSYSGRWASTSSFTGKARKKR